MNFFNPMQEVDLTRANLPHWEQAGKLCFVTFRLADSMPQEKLKIWEYERDVWLNAHPQPWSDDEEAEYAEKFRNKIDECLDAGYGSCILRIKECREIVENTLKYFDGERYKIYAFVVMPNHVHVLFEPLGAFKIAEILHSWKRFSSQKLNEFLGKSGALWQKESWDRYIRNQKHFNQTLWQFFWKHRQMLILFGSIKIPMTTKISIPFCICHF